MMGDGAKFLDYSDQGGQCGKGGGSCTKAPVAALVLVRLLLVLLPGERPVLAGVLLLLMLLVASPWLPPWACFCEQLAEAGTLAAIVVVGGGGAGDELTGSAAG
eukprot:1156674-Pelagomonas_calceolata.AAC.25